jgi:hypothetical protein
MELEEIDEETLNSGAEGYVIPNANMTLTASCLRLAGPIVDSFTQTPQSILSLIYSQLHVHTNICQESQLRRLLL